MPVNLSAAGFQTAWDEFSSFAPKSGEGFFPNATYAWIWSAGEAVSVAVKGNYVDPNPLNEITQKLKTFTGNTDFETQFVHDFLSAATRYLQLAAHNDTPGASAAYSNALFAFESFVNDRLRSSNALLASIDQSVTVAKRLALVMSSTTSDTYYDAQSVSEAARADRYRRLAWTFLGTALALAIWFASPFAADADGAATIAARITVVTIVLSLAAVAFRTETLHRNDAREYREASLALATLPGFVENLSESDASALIATVGTQAFRRNSHSAGSTVPDDSNTVGTAALVALLMQYTKK